ncbi:ATP-binding protein [Allorhizocola rhizosphaerae]|uniref:ATP-binding protein n=1 Tax=Allorhizocola rhizosphaerae TaxID=1872709 RepID=UPI0013C3072D|nr:tetratricopeptide repeat protein [Allorhizocola rhizosphaerae]
MSSEPIVAVNTIHTIHDLAGLLRELKRRQARRRGDAELTYRELAARTGWSIGIIAGYFGGRILPPTDRFDVLMSLLDTTPAERGALATARDRVQAGRHPAAESPWPIPRQLPANGFAFTGRGDELAHLDMMAGTPGAIAVLSGTAGVGKTALAVHWAHRVVKRFPEGQLYVNLRGFDAFGVPKNPEEAVRGFLEALGITAQNVPADPTVQFDLYRSLLANRRVLVILDNAREAEQVRPLLPGAPGCMTVITSRNDLTSLVAVDGAHPLILDLLPVGQARQLLAHRLGAQRISAEAEVVDEVVSRCARLPLALVIAAARASARPTLPLAELATELRAAGGGLDPLRGQDTTADARVAFSCSYRHLSAEAAMLFGRLGVHPGPDVGAAAAASLGGVGLAQARAAMEELARAHLVNEHAPGRYTLHDLLRAFARERVSTSEREEASRRLREHYSHTAYAAALLMYPHRDPIGFGPVPDGVEPLADRDEARAWFEREHRVLLAVMSETRSWRLAWALADYLDWRGHWHDLAMVQALGLEGALRSGDRPGQAHAHRNLARALIRLGQLEAAQGHLSEAIALARGAGDRLTEAASHLNLSLVLEKRGENRDALHHSELALELFFQSGHQAGQARAFNAIGWYRSLLGEHEEALACCERALALQLAIGRPVDFASTLDSLGFAQHNLGRYEDAAESYRRAVELYREVGDRYHEADTLIHLSDAHRAAGDEVQAWHAWQEALDILDDLHHPRVAVTSAVAVDTAVLGDPTTLVSK